MINVPDARLELLSPVVHLILGQTLHALSERPLDRTDPVLLVGDPLPNHKIMSTDVSFLHNLF